MEWTFEQPCSCQPTEVYIRRSRIKACSRKHDKIVVPVTDARLACAERRLGGVWRMFGRASDVPSTAFDHGTDSYWRCKPTVTDNCCRDVLNGNWIIFEIQVSILFDDWSKCPFFGSIRIYAPSTCWIATESRSCVGRAAQEIFLLGDWRRFHHPLDRAVQAPRHQRRTFWGVTCGREF